MRLMLNPCRLGKLAPHLAQLAGFGLTILTTPELDFSKGSVKPLPFEFPLNCAGF